MYIFVPHFSLDIFFICYNWLTTFLALPSHLPTLHLLQSIAHFFALSHNHLFSLKYTWPNLQLLIWFISESCTLPPRSRRNCDKLIGVLLLTLSTAYDECRAYPVGQHSDYLLQWMAGSQQQQSRLFVPKEGCSTMWPNWLAPVRVCV